MKIGFFLAASLAVAADPAYVETGVIELPPAAGTVAAVATGLRNQLYVLNRSEVPILVYAADGTYRKGWGRGLFVTPQSLRVDAFGNIWTADAGNHVVRKFSPDGSLVRTFGEVGVPGDGPAHLRDPRDMAVGFFGRVYIADSGNRRIVRFLRDGTFSAEFGHSATNLAVDARERLCLSGPGPGEVRLLSAEGKRLTESPSSELSLRLSPLKATDRQGNLYVAEPDSKSVRKFQKK